MNQGWRAGAGLALLAIGLACLAYAAVGLYHSGAGEPPPASSAPGSATTTGSPADGATPTDGDERRAESESADDSASTASSAVPPAGTAKPEQPRPSAPATKAGASSAAPAGRTREQAKREAWALWIVVTLGLFLILFLGAVLVVRRVRPRPMPRTGPTDNTDLWQEAGRRIKLE